MRCFDPHIHMTSRTTDDYEAMRRAGIVAVIEPSFWLGQPRTHIGTFEDYFRSLIGWEPFRASQFGIRHFCTLSLNPKEANNPSVAAGVMELLPAYLNKDAVVAVGEIGYDEMTPDEDRYFELQLELARRFELPVLVHTPHRDKKRGTERSLALIRNAGFSEDRVLIDHNTEETLPLVLATRCWAGHSIYPKTKMDEPRMVALVKRYGAERIIINSAADWGVSDPLKVPKTAALMRESGIAEKDIETIIWHNPTAFFSQSGKLDLGAVEQDPDIDQTQLWEGNSVLRGQAPVGEGKGKVKR
ncbi:MAG TPA: TatD family hydrolase [Nitrospiraceae bacterium]|nr:TatD family hydrolase [Nitrospiraceae bacterium]